MATNLTSPTGDTRNAKRLLLPFALGLLGLCALLQLVIAVAGSTIGVVAVVGTLVVAACYAAFLITRRDELKSIRFGPLVAHALAYVFVVGSFQLHAAFLAFADSDELRGSDLPIDAGWLGPTFAMAGFWAIGFAIHAVASISQRGYEA